MDELLNYTSQFGKFDAQEAKLAISKLNIINLRKHAYFSEAGSVRKRVGFVLKGVLRGCYITLYYIRTLHRLFKPNEIGLKINAAKK
jgi:hypothetical protein